MNILYIEKGKKGCNYYSDIIKSISKIHKTITLKNKNLDNNKILSIVDENNINIIIIGFGITDCGYETPKFNISIKNIPVYIILNKEYAALNKKLDWIKSINPNKAFTVHHDYELYQKKINVPFHRIMWSANDKLFKKYDDEYKYDLFFSGVIRKEQTNNLRYKILEKINKLNEYNLLINASFNDKKPKNLKSRNKDFSNKEYAKTINHSKIVLTTTGPADLVGTRYFEIMASNKALIICNRMPKNVYEDIVIDKFNCVMFNDENDFIKKCKHYLENEDERLKIVSQAYTYFLEKHTWKHKVKNLLDNL